MLFSTPTQFIVLAFALVAGWLLGLASHPGGGKWKDRYATEREAHAAARRDAEAKLTESTRLTTDARRGTDDRLIQANGRIAELEREKVRLANTTPSTSSVERELPGDTPIFAAASSRPSYATQTPSRRQVPTGAKRGWFDF